MFGFSVYLSRDLTPTDHEMMRQMRQAGFKGVFTSLHIPEDDAAQLKARVQLLGSWCQELDLQLIADVSAVGLKQLDIAVDDANGILALGVSGLRIDDGIEMATVAQLSRAMPIALNASTISQADVDALHENHAQFTHLEAWHNYYPRPETGLATDWYQAKNSWLKALGLTTMGFVPGDGQLRGPLKLGLPTLESHRELNPLAAALDLQQLATDRIYIGDNALAPETLAGFKAYLNDGVIRLRVDQLPQPLLNVVWHNRPDVARDVIRLQEGRLRQLLKTAPVKPALPRLTGAITVDNTEYQRYAGELQIMRHELPVDSRVNVLGHVCDQDLALLPFVGAGQALKFAEIKGDSQNA